MFLIDSHIFFFLASFLNTKPDLKNLNLNKKKQEESNHYEEEMASYWFFLGKLTQYKTWPEKHHI